MRNLLILMFICNLGLPAKAEDYATANAIYAVNAMHPDVSAVDVQYGASQLEEKQIRQNLARITHGYIKKEKVIYKGNSANIIINGKEYTPVANAPITK